MITKKNNNYGKIKNVIYLIAILNKKYGVSIYHSLQFFDLEDNSNTDYIYATKLIAKPTNDIKEGFKLLELYETKEDYNLLVKNYRDIERKINEELANDFKENNPLKVTFIRKEDDEDGQILKANKSYNAKRNQLLGQFYRRKDIEEILHYEYIVNLMKNEDHKYIKLKKALNRIDDYIVKDFELIKNFIIKTLHSQINDENIKPQQAVLYERMIEDIKPLQKAKVVKI
ncbi:hypothetical protein KDX23_03310 [Burkholderia vietnamiensis]|uniref:hypothetical protein n=1 Tax=Burkholderia vietnamiensis TaxID=60552 RepID=UPI001B968288|nr:hypothetical protein [Burkholderia vietnamiensis]MBR8081768.1 hypothetical protein [Burkholderia vietnamiensis]